MGALATAAIARMDEVLPWYRAMPAENRSWVNLVAQAGVAAFVEWFRQPGRSAGHQRRRVRHRAARADPLGDPAADRRAGPRGHRGRRGADRADRPRRRGRRARGGAALLPRDRLRRRPGLRPGGRGPRRLGRPAGVAGRRRAAARRGRRLAAVPGRGAGLGQPRLRWSSWSGTTPDAEPEAVVDEIRRVARAAHLDVLTGVQGDRLVAILGGRVDPVRTTRLLVAQFGPGPVVVGPTVPDLLAAGEQRRGRAWPGCSPRRPGRTRRARSPPTTCCPSGRWPATPLARRAPRARDLPAAAVAPGPRWSRRCPRSSSRPRRWRRTARVLFVHPNTVRYRLRRVAEVSGYAPTDPRQALRCGWRWPWAGWPTPARDPPSL